MDRPTVTVVVPTRNERRHIGECLAAILSQDYPREFFDVIVADGMSDDGTVEEIARVAGDDPRVRVIPNPGRIVPTGMNRAIALAKGKYIVRVDGHTVIPRDYVDLTVRTLERTGAEGVGGVMLPVASRGFKEAVALATSTPFGVGNSAFHYATTEQLSDSVYLGAYPASTFERFGGYDEKLVRNQDDELNYRIRAGGGAIVLNPAIRSLYHPRSGVRALFSQYFQYGWWKAEVMRRVPSMIRVRHLVPTGFVLAIGVLALASPAAPRALAVLGILLLLHAGLSLAFCSRVRLGDAGALRAGGGALALSLTPLATLIIHLGYGLGLAAGLLALAGGGGRAGDRRPAASTRQER